LRRAIAWLLWAAVVGAVTFFVYLPMRRYVHDHVFGWGGVLDLLLAGLMGIFTPPVSADLRGRHRISAPFREWSIVTKVLVIVVFGGMLAVFLVAALGYLLATNARASGTEPARNCTGSWSAQGKYGYEPPRRIEAPDGRHAIVPGEPSLLLLNDRGLASRDIGVSVNLTEILWAPNSRKFAATESDGGLVGTWHLFVITIDRGNRLSHRDLSEVIQGETMEFAKCFEGPESRNVGAAAWLNRNELLVIAEVPPHSSCTNMGAITGFRVSAISGKVLERLPEKKLRKRYGKSLGCRFVPP
jgi:hypothetical protein